MRFFFESWQRKAISIVLSVILWMMVNQSLITSKTINNIPVRVVNVPAGKTIVDLQNNGILTKRISLNLVGNKTLLDELNANDLEVVIDAQNKTGEWIASVSLRNLISTNPDIDLVKGINRLSPTSVIIRLTKLVSEKIPVFVTQPIGEAPKDYQYLDIWPYQLSLNVSGPEEVVKRLKTKGVRLTFDLSHVTKTDLDTQKSRVAADEVSFFIPEVWKRVNIPLLSEGPIEIDDPLAKDLRIDFVRVSSIPIRARIPVSLYFSTEHLTTYNPRTISLASRAFIEKLKGLNLVSIPLYTKGVSQLFVKVVEQMLQLTVAVDPSKDNQVLNWSVEFINPRLLEDRYVSLMMSDISEEEVRELQPQVREEYLRNRFRSYMNRFQFYKSDDKRLELSAYLESDKVIIEEK